MSRKLWRGGKQYTFTCCLPNTYLYYLSKLTNQPRRAPRNQWEGRRARAHVPEAKQNHSTQDSHVVPHHGTN